MDKTKQKKRNSYNAIVIKAIAKKYNLSTQYIRQCVRGDRNSLTADKIRSDYKDMDKEVQNFIEKQ